MAPLPLNVLGLARGAPSSLESGTAVGMGSFQSYMGAQAMHAAQAVPTREQEINGDDRAQLNSSHPAAWLDHGFSSLSHQICEPCGGSSDMVATRTECRYYMQNTCNMMNDAFHKKQFSHTCKYHPHCTRLGDKQHCATFDHPGLEIDSNLPEPVQRGRRPCSFFLQGRCHKMDDPAHTEFFSHGEEHDDIPAFAFDCEFIKVVAVDANGQSLDPRTRLPAFNPADVAYRWPVSIGVVDQHMETLMYTRIRKPRGTIVHDDRFGRMGSGIRSCWTVGLSRRDVTSMIVQLIRESSGEVQRSSLVGWNVEHDLRALGFLEAANFVRNGERKGLALRCALRGEDSKEAGLEQNPSDEQSEATEAETICDVVELQDFFRTSHGDLPLRLAEAFRHVLQRTVHAHDAVEDARMTMELYTAWHRQGRPPVRYECDHVAITATQLDGGHGFHYEQNDANHSGVDGRRGGVHSIPTGLMVKLRSGRLWISGHAVHVGTAFYLRRCFKTLFLFDSEEHAFNLSSDVGLQQITRLEQVSFVVACELLDRTKGVEGWQRFVSNGACVSGNGEIIRQVTQDGKSWVQISSPDDPLKSLGWVGPLFQGSRHCFRVARPFPLDVYFFFLQYDAFAGDALSRMELLLELKPEISSAVGGSPPQEDITRDQASTLVAYKLKFRERETRNAYWRTMQDKLIGCLSLQKNHTGPPNEPWKVHGGTNLIVSRPGPGGVSRIGCAVHIWDQPR